MLSGEGTGWGPGGGCGVGGGLGGVLSRDAGCGFPVKAGRNHLQPEADTTLIFIYSHALKQRGFHGRHCSQHFITLTRWILQQPHQEDAGATTILQNKKPARGGQELRAAQLPAGAAPGAGGLRDGCWATAGAQPGVQ